ncbi:MAG: HAD-IA family hydrolase [Thermoanaerobaculales bacterium]|jgi:putative hydrolase of the HAD superfamily|nr:HAD-IA family hydrolase [Thermoanaerobaculales bacterium]
MTRITAICFDAGNTLLYCDPSPGEIYAEALSRHGRTVTNDEVAPVFAAAWADLQEDTPPGIDRYGSVPGGEAQWWGAFVREVLRRLDHDAAWEPLLAELYAAFSRPEIWQAYPETRATLSALRRAGLRSAVISNWDRRLPKILADLELTPSFDTVTVSSIEGMEKPAAAIFESTLARLGVDAAQALHVGDSPLEDYEGAAAVGMTPVLIDRPGAFVGNGYRRIGSLDELLTMVGC